MFTSLGQILLDAEKKAAREPRRYNVLPENPVFSPLASSRFRLQYAPGSHVIYDSRALSGGIFPGQEDSEWWLPASDEPAEETDTLDRTGVFSPFGAPRYRNQFPIPRPGGFDPQLNAGDLVNLGVADILNYLREKELGREKSGAGTNPFDEALEATSEDTSSVKDEQVANADPSKGKDDKGGDDSSSGSGSSAPRNFLFVGRFGDQPVQMAVATSDSHLLEGGPALFDLAGIGETVFDLQVLLRNRNSEESVAFGSLNDDGLLDMVVTDRSTSMTQVYVADGTGGYVPKAYISAGIGPAMAAIGDFSGDGSPDVSVLIGQRIVVDGKGLRKFVFFPTSIARGDYSSMLPYDYNGDGFNDLLLTDYRNSITTVYQNQGEALFAPSDSLALESFPYLRSSVDLDGDWVNDLVHIQYLGGHVALVFQSGSDGTIRNIANTILDPSIYYALGDFDNDGVVDIALARRR